MGLHELPGEPPVQNKHGRWRYMSRDGDNQHGWYHRSCDVFSTGETCPACGAPTPTSMPRARQQGIEVSVGE